MEGQSRQHPQSKKDEGGGDQEGPAFTCQFMKPCECWGSTSRPTHICLHMRIADAYQVICLVQSIGGHGRWFDVVGASGGGGRTDGRTTGVHDDEEGGYFGGKSNFDFQFPATRKKKKSMRGGSHRWSDRHRKPSWRDFLLPPSPEVTLPICPRWAVMHRATHHS